MTHFPPSSRPLLRGIGTLALFFSLLAAFAVPARAGDSGSADRAHRLVRLFRRSPQARWLTAPAAAAVRYAATGSWVEPRSDRGSAGSHDGIAPNAPTGAAGDVRVNDPSGDGIGDADMTTQSETTVAASGAHVLVAYNDDGRSAVSLKAADDLSGYSWSDDHGATWHDGDLPNHFPTINLGDPVLAADRGGRFYYASLALDTVQGTTGVVVARSDDGGGSFGTPRFVIAPEDASNARTLIFVDKPWMTVGPDPAHLANDVVYVTWTEFVLGRGIGTRIRMSESRDQGRSWSRPVTLASAHESFRSSLTVTLTGSSVIARPTTGAAFVGFERIAETARGRTFPSEEVARSGDGGRTFSKVVRVAPVHSIGKVVTPACGRVLVFGGGRAARVQEFPMMAFGPGHSVVMTFDTRGSNGLSRVVVARSTDRGRTWRRNVIRTPSDAFMPAIAGGPAEVDVIFYQRAGDHSLETSVARSSDGIHFTVDPLSSSTFRVPVTLPSTDPLLATCYMGDYLGATRAGGATLAAWGDNRDQVVNGFWPDGRPDPDVFFDRLT